MSSFDDWIFDEEYTDDQRLDELRTADDYNRFEEEQLAQDNDLSDWEEENEMPTTPLDLIGILAQHESFHTRLMEGEFKEAGEFDELLKNEQLNPIISAIGLEGVGKLLHIIHELLVSLYADYADNPQQFTSEQHAQIEYVSRQLESVMRWATIARVMGYLPGLPSVNLDLPTLDV